MRPVIVSVEHLPPEGRVVPFDFAVADVAVLLSGAEEGDVGALASLAGEVRLLPSGNDVFVLGALHTRVSYTCVRCLERFEREVQADFHLVGTQEADQGAGEVELHREDLEVEFLEGASLDLGAVVAEQLFLALEPHPVCREPCQGLCPDCGGNRNFGECRCPAKPADPRLAALASWKPSGAG